MKKYILLIMAAASIVSCSKGFDNVVDFTEVENPNLSESSVIGQTNSSVIWLAGLERQLGNVFNETLILSELGSDNYVNTQTFYNQFLDGLNILETDPDIRDTQRQIHRLRELATFGLESVGPADPNYNSEIEADYNYFEGLSYLFSAMYFSALPVEPLGVAMTSAENYQLASDAFDIAIALNPLPEYYLAKARANYYLGNQAIAVTAAESALNLSSDFLRTVSYDNANEPVNTFESALYGRATFDDLQPLPTLDFLDPKYSFLSTALDAPVNYLKAEEALLILAEANLVDGNAVAAQANIQSLLDLIATREVREIDDSIEGRTQIDPGTRPDNADVVVNGRVNLVLDRQSGLVSIPSVSGTSLVDADLPLFTADDSGLELLYRTRQEVFIAEGLRFVDMGVKLIIDENERLLNDNISAGDLGTEPVIPSFIASVVSSLDAISYDAATGVATTTIDLNAILVANKSSEEVLPFN
jgi:tetratricopeptide (TPR) repeat protein